MKYIVYTTEGYTELPVGNEVENCQIIDFVDEAASASAIRARYAAETGIRPDRINVVPFVGSEAVGAIREVVAYLKGMGDAQTPEQKNVCDAIRVLESSFDL